MLTVLVAGSRDWSDRFAVWNRLDRLLVEHSQLRVRHGANPRGADAHASQWCLAAQRAHFQKFLIVEQPRLALWGTHGSAAGPLRNARMLDEHPVPDLLLAFPLLCQRQACRFMPDGPHWTHGTKDMIERTDAAGIEVRLFKPGS